MRVSLSRLRGRLNTDLPSRNPYVIRPKSLGSASNFAYLNKHTQPSSKDQILLVFRNFRLYTQSHNFQKFPLAIQPRRANLSQLLTVFIFRSRICITRINSNRMSPKTLRHTPSECSLASIPQVESQPKTSTPLRLNEMHLVLL